MGERFTDELRESAAAIWEAQHEHPFVRGIASSTLPRERFAHYFRQDYLFLIDYARALSLAAARSPDLDTMRRFSELAGAVLGEEMDLHRSFGADMGIPVEEMERQRAAPTTRGYTDFLVRSAATGDFLEVLGALLPCMWGYAEIGERLAAEGPPEDEHYARWVATYADPEFQKLAAWCRELTDRTAEGAGEQLRGAARQAFVTCSRYELAFWEMGWTLEDWPNGQSRSAAPPRD